MAERKILKEYATSVAVYREDLYRLLTNMKKRGVNRYTPSYLEERLRLANDLHTNIRDCHIKFCSAYEPEELTATPYMENKVYELALEAFESVEAHILEHLSRLEENSSPANTSSGSATEFTGPSSVRLPKIDLPKFNGDYTEWSTFHDTFRSMIHDNVGLPGIQKFHYLKSCLTGEARAVLQALSVSGENYATAWATLVDRYQNKRIITATLLNRLTQISPTGANNLAQLKELRDTVAVTLDALRNLSYAVDLWDPLMVHLIVSHFEPTLRLEWERVISDLVEYPSFARLKEYINGKICMLESLGIGKSAPIKNQDRPVRSHAVGVRRPNCPQRGKDHAILRCDKFLGLLPPARLKIALRKRWCVNCLRPGHPSSSCGSPHRCKKCNKLHHSLLHLETHVGNDITPPTEAANQSTSITSEASGSDLATHLSITDSRTVLLATLLVQVEGGNGRSSVARGLVDPGSETSFLSENLAQLLRVQRTPVNASVYGVTGGTSHQVKSEAQVGLHSLHDDESLKITALILPRITAYAPMSYSSVTFPDLVSLKLADRYANARAPIDFLIGADYYAQLLTGQTRTSPDRSLVAQSTLFGWIVSGVLPSRPRSSPVTVHHCCEVEKDLRRFWELEEVPTSVPAAEEDQFCEDHFRATVRQTSDGRFEVGLPISPHASVSSLGYSRHIADSSLARIIQRANKNPLLLEKYVRFMDEYEALGHMSRVPEPDKLSDTRVYLPHHAVFKLESGQEKVRVVFNASSKTSSGVSLNDILLVGPKLQKDITAILMNWRSYRFAGVTDIVKMFRQISVRPEDRQLQTILWQSSGRTYAFELNTVTYGTSRAPFLAMRVLEELARRHGGKFPEAKRVLLNSVYVDDLLFGADSLERLESIKIQLVQLLAKGGFSLSKWAANSTLGPLGSPTRDTIVFRETEEASHKVLGVAWNTDTDSFYFQISTIAVPVVTKRILLSENSKIFDPMGWISPVTVVLKQIMQGTWLLKLSWDEEVPEPARSKWVRFYSQLRELHSIQIPRWDRYQPETDSFELIGFCDASSLSYGAVVYAKVSSPSGEIDISLVMAKSKVAPIKTLSIPRLELVAAVLLAKLIKHIKRSITRPISAVSCFSDSQVVLAWIAQHPARWKVFVANRVSYIQTELPEARWNYINTKHNPADLNSRGVTPAELTTSTLWWPGPELLKQDFYPIAPELDTTEESRKVALLVQNTSKEPSEPFSRLSSWPKTIRIVAYMYRFVSRCRNRHQQFDPFLSHSELLRARGVVFKAVQLAAFPRELAALSRGENLASRSSLSPLSPFLDSKGLMRVGGRLSNSILSDNEKHPVILPSGHIAELITRSVHLRTLHGGVQVTLAMIRKEVWIVNARSLAKKVIHNCVTCVRERAALGKQLMGSLPSARVTRSHPFSHTGVDYAGPFVVNTSAGRGSKTRKAYIAVFVCLAMRAFHLELVSAYNTDSFLAAFSRFVARRGKPATMYSDNGLNFRGANAELRRAFNDVIREAVTQPREPLEGIEWKFIPVATPHWGGLWERGVRAVKHHLKRILGTFTPTFEEFCTLLCKIEACLNSRPLISLHDNIDSLEVLTPGHFLAGRALLAPPERSVLDLRETTLSRWQKVLRVTEAFWKRWSSEYLNTLQSRSKWRTKTDPFHPGDIVIIKNASNPPCKWSMGRVLKLIPGVDSVPRVALVKTGGKEIQRSFTQLCRLPVPTDKHVPPPTCS